ncbi:putative glutathione S-transferase-like protein [Rosellinia necatrix]|uniref:Putative glutathione S-transferase-like protein n=1 Tax=Rosellinia necatrix TaxID=77044 RepID=A0A1W2TB54_ROSNE|nr:putative glutathione S-transferase-like protein [Rosellinia necatrix]
MAPFGKIYTYPDNLRVHRALIIADLNGLEIEIPPFTMRETNRTPEFLSKFALGKVPAFEGADGFALTESVAIATYIAKSGPKADQLLGKDAKTQALITQWASFAEFELANNAIVPIAMVVMKAYAMDENRFNSAIEGLERNARYLEVSLKGGKKYLVGDRLTLADLMVTSFCYWAFKHLIGADLRKELPNLVAYVEAFANVPEHKKYYGELEMCETSVSFGSG